MVVKSNPLILISQKQQLESNCKHKITTEPTSKVVAQSFPSRYAYQAKQEHHWELHSHTYVK